MTENEYCMRLKGCLRDLYYEASDKMFEQECFDDALARYAALQLCYSESQRKRPWRALYCCLSLILIILYVFFLILELLILRGS